MGAARKYATALARYRLPDDGTLDAQWGAVRRGIEKENLRVGAAGRMALTPHPPALGSALCNPAITTDFSEALLEFITPPLTGLAECLAAMTDIHRFTLANLPAGELLWPASMPCPLGEQGAADGAIPIAEYGRSNIGRLKNLYRRGLHERYGSEMQTVAGIHYNFSMPDSFWPAYRQARGNEDAPQTFQTHQYLALIRNFQRLSWLLIYLFGASPAADKSFVRGRQHDLAEWDSRTLFKPHATCLRMSRLGYKSAAQKSLFVCYNDLDSYIACLHEAMNKPYPAYEAIGLRRGGDYRQINTALLQLENEFYSVIRPKRAVGSGERPLQGLRRGGIEYVEVRALDLNPHLTIGVDAAQLRFLDSFLLHCLLADSPYCHEEEFFEVGENIRRVAEEGRRPDLSLRREARPVPLAEWATETLAAMEPATVLLDHAHGGDDYRAALELQRAKVEDPALTPAGAILAEMAPGKRSFFDFAMGRAEATGATLRAQPLAAERAAEFAAAAAASLVRQRDLEAADEIDFDTFLAQWNERGAQL